MALLGRGSVPPGRLGVVARHAPAVLVELAHDGLGVGQPGFRQWLTNFDGPGKASLVEGAFTGGGVIWVDRGQGG